MIEVSLLMLATPIIGPPPNWPDELSEDAGTIVPPIPEAVLEPGVVVVGVPPAGFAVPASVPGWPVAGGGVDDGELPGDPKLPGPPKLPEPPKLLDGWPAGCDCPIVPDWPMGWPMDPG